MINVEVIGGSLLVQHYIEEIGEPSHLRLVSNSDLVTSMDRTRIGVIWDLSVMKIDEKSCDFHKSDPQLRHAGTLGLPWQAGDS